MTWQVTLRRKFVAAAGTRHAVVYPAGSTQLAWQDRHGFIWLQGAETGWYFATMSAPGIDFDWLHGDPRTAEECACACAREIPAVFGPGEAHEHA